MNSPGATAADVRHNIAQFLAFWDEDPRIDAPEEIRENADQCLTAVLELARAVEAYRDAVHATIDQGTLNPEP